MPTEQIGYVYRTRPWSPLDFRRYAKSSDAADGGELTPKMHYASMMEWQTWKSQTLLPQGVWVQVPFEAPVEFSNFSKRKFSIEQITLN